MSPGTCRLRPRRVAPSEVNRSTRGSCSFRPLCDHPIHPQAFGLCGSPMQGPLRQAHSLHAVYLRIECAQCQASTLPSNCPIKHRQSSLSRNPCPGHAIIGQHSKRARNGHALLNFVCASMLHALLLAQERRIHGSFAMHAELSCCSVHGAAAVHHQSRWLTYCKHNLLRPPGGCRAESGLEKRRGWSTTLYAQLFWLSSGSCGPLLHTSSDQKSLCTGGATAFLGHLACALLHNMLDTQQCDVQNFAGSHGSVMPCRTPLYCLAERVCNALQNALPGQK